MVQNIVEAAKDQFPQESIDFVFEEVVRAYRELTHEIEIYVAGVERQIQFGTIILSILLTLTRLDFFKEVNQLTIVVLVFAILGIMIATIGMYTLNGGWELDRGVIYPNELQNRITHTAADLKRLVIENVANVYEANSGLFFQKAIQIGRMRRILNWGLGCLFLALLLEIGVNIIHIF